MDLLWFTSIISVALPLARSCFFAQHCRSFAPPEVNLPREQSLSARKQRLPRAGLALGRLSPLRCRTKLLRILSFSYTLIEVF
jgi:hypothetical protein